MASVIDDLYDIVTKENPTNKKLYDILETMRQTTSFGSNSFTDVELYIKMSQSPNADDKLIKILVQEAVNSWDTNNMQYLIIDNGSKKLFDELWEKGFGNGKPIRLWKSKHADTKQLKSIYSSLFVKDKEHVDKVWLKKEKEKYFKHPNAPKDILARNVKNIDNLKAMAENPNLGNMPKVFERVCGKAKILSSSRFDADDVLEILLNNNGIEWKKIAKGIDLVKQLNSMYGKISWASERRKGLILEFCAKHADEMPEKILSFLYDKTEDEKFLPADARDIFLF